MICAIYDEKNKSKFFKTFTNEQIKYYPHNKRLMAITPGGPARVFDGQAVVVDDGVVSIIGGDLAIKLMTMDVEDDNNNHGIRENRSDDTQERAGTSAMEQSVEYEKDSVVCAESNCQEDETRQGSKSKRRGRGKSKKTCQIDDITTQT
jgi:hypothetical protein